MILPDGTDLRKVTVLSKAEWDRIEQELNRRQIEEERIQRAKAQYEEQKKRSKEIVKGWGNTLFVSVVECDFILTLYLELTHNALSQYSSSIKHKEQNIDSIFTMNI
jgi:hypothetical protein